MKTIEERWNDFYARNLSTETNAAVVETVRLAFYAGFKAMLDANIEIADLDESAAIIELEKLNTESRRH